MINFVILTAPRSKKNSSRIITRYGKKKIIPSEAYETFEEKCLWLIPGKYKKLKIDYPVNIKATYYVDSSRRVDKTNLESALMDVLVKAGVILDDSAINPAIVVSTDGSKVFVDRKNPRIEIEIERAD